MHLHILVQYGKADGKVGDNADNTQADLPLCKKNKDEKRQCVHDSRVRHRPSENIYRSRDWTEKFHGNDMSFTGLCHVHVTCHFHGVYR